MLTASIMPALSDPSNAYNQQHLYVLNSLARVKSVVLLTDIPDSEKLTVNLFTICFDILASASNSSSGEQIGKNVEYDMTEMMATVIDESTSIPPEAIDVIVAQFLRIDPHIIAGKSTKSKKNASNVVDERQSTLLAKELPPSYNMAKTLCNTSSDKMARHVSQYFTDIIVDASNAPKQNGTAKRRRFSEDLESSDLDVTSGPTEEDLRELRKAHQLLRELWRACPKVLQNVVPQLEAELSAENFHLRLLATEAFGDIISGIGAAGLPAQTSLDPAAYPYITLSDSQGHGVAQNAITKPSSPQSFSQAYPQAYTTFLSRVHDKSPAIRAAWTTGIGRILSTAAGGVGLSHQEEDRLVKDLARMLSDADDRVRMAAIAAISTFSLKDVVQKLGALGGVDQSGSVLATLADRMRDRKHGVRIEAMLVLSRLWGAAAGESLVGDERVTQALGAVPSKIFSTYFTNDLEIHTLLDRVLYENLIPLSFPPIKSKGSKLPNGSSQKMTKGPMNGDHDEQDIDPDRIRAERLLLLAKDLDDRAKKVFYALQARKQNVSPVVLTYLRRSEEFNGGVVEDNEKEIRRHLSKLIDNLAKGFPESLRISDHLWKFAKMHDRRAYQLIRFCIAPESDYRTVYKAIKELSKRIEQSNTAPADLWSSILALLYRASSLIFNRSHVPAIMEFSRMEESKFSTTAHEMLRDISTRTPEVLKAEIQEMCVYLQDEAPSGKRSNDLRAVDNLKACAAFAKRFATEIPRDRKFAHSMVSFSLHGIPAEAAKHAVTILLASSDKKEHVAQDLLSKCVDGFEYGADDFLSRLASISQLVLLAPEQAEKVGDVVSEIAIGKVLLRKDAATEETSDDYIWADVMDTDCEAKCWALKTLVNRVRSHTEAESLAELAAYTYTLLSGLVENGGRMDVVQTTPAQRSRLRLLAARTLLKLCTKKATDNLVTPLMFNQLSLVAQDDLFPVRSSFLKRVRKYIGSAKLSQRFFTIPFLLAFEPKQAFKSDTATWIRSRTNVLHGLQREQPNSKIALLMESVFARLISLLAHHPDYSSEADLEDFAQYILFYLRSVATEENLSLIYHIAQRVKQSRDAIAPSPELDSKLYQLSDLAQLTIRQYEDAHNWTIQTQPGKASLPRSLYTDIRDHDEALDIAEKNHLPEGIEEKVEALVKASLKAPRTQNRKRKSENDGLETHAKKAKSLPLRKASGNKERRPKTTAASAAPSKKLPKKAKPGTNGEVNEKPVSRRRSGRVRSDEGAYREREDDEDDEDMMDGVAQWSYAQGDDDAEEQSRVEETVSAETEAAREESMEEKQAEEWDMPATPPPQTSPRTRKTAGPAAKKRGKKGRGKA